MAMISARVPWQRFTTKGPIARFQKKLATRTELARPPAYYVVCATVAVLNIVGLVMILSASSVAALSDYGSSWYFFNRQLHVGDRRAGRVPRRVARRLPRAGGGSRRGCSSSRS